MSSVVATDSHRVPIVAFAGPYHTPSGRRVFSGAYELNRTPLADFLAAGTAIPQSGVYVVDAVDTIVARNAVTDGSGQSRTLPAALAAARRQASDGNYTATSSRRHFFTSQPVAGTPGSWS